MSKQHRRVRVRSWQATLILTMFFIAVAGAAGIGWWYARESPAHQGPIVLITVDGLPAGAVPDAVPEDAPARPEAPAAADVERSGLDTLAAESVIFERAYTHAPLVVPSHVSLLSGRLPFEHGVRDEAGFAVTPSTRMLAEMLRNRGFSTAAVLSSPQLRPETGVGRGFSYVGYPSDVASSGSDVPVVTVPGASAAAAASPATDTVSMAEEWARQQTSQRYFLMLQVRAADAEAAVTRMATLLRERKLYDDATIVLVGARGGSAVRLDDASLHVPLLIKQPEREGAGRRVTAPVQHIDLLPTILDLVRAPIPGDLHGRSLRPLLGSDDARLASQPIYSESLAAAFRVGGNPAFALTVNDVRYVNNGMEALVPVATTGTADAAPAALVEQPDLAPMRATLERMLDGYDGLPASSAIPAEHRRDLAKAGFLGGLSRAVAGASLTLEEQDTLLAEHQRIATLIGEGRLIAAARALQALVRQHPTLAALHVQFAVLATELGRTSEAIASLRAASALRPDAPEIPRMLATVLSRTGDAAEAQGQAELAIALSTPLGPPEIALSHEIAARLAVHRGDRDAALAHADEAQAANPTLPVHAFIEGSLLAAGGAHDEAAATLRKAVALLRQHDLQLEGLQVVLARSLLALDLPDEAEAAFRDELEAFPQNVDAYAGLALLLGERDRVEERDAVIADLLSAVPTPDGYAAAARVWTTLGERARAERVRSDAQARFRPEPAPSRVVAHAQSR